MLVAVRDEDAPCDLSDETLAARAPAQREVLALRYLEDLTTSEIAEVSDRSRGAVRILLHRARNSLRRALEERGIS